MELLIKIIERDFPKEYCFAILFGISSSEKFTIYIKSILGSRQINRIMFTMIIVPLTMINILAMIIGYDPFAIYINTTMVMMCGLYDIHCYNKCVRAAKFILRTASTLNEESMSAMTEKISKYAKR